MMLLTVPVSTIEPVPLPVTLTPVPLAAVSVPVGTLRVTLTAPAAASTSLMLRPARVTLVSSAVVNVAGRVLTGASLTALTMEKLKVAVDVALKVSEMVYVALGTAPL